MSSNFELQIADVLSVAISQLTCCEEITEYPNTYSMNFEPGSHVDNFWMNASKTFFYDSLLLTATLLDRDRRTVSFFNWKEFFNVYSDWLNDTAKEFTDSGLKTVRDQIVGHIDVSNHNNRLPRYRRQGVINNLLIERLKKTQTSMVGKFDEYTRSKGTPYSLDSFFSGNIAREETRKAINGNRPKLTKNFVI